MQRWLFLFSFISVSTLLCAQELQQTELSFWFCAESPHCERIPARVSYRFSANPGESLTLAASESLTITGVQLKQGRLKRPLAFSRRGDQLIIQAGPINDLRSEVQINYQIATSGHPDGYFQQTDRFIAFNPFKLRGQDLAAKAGEFYPAFPEVNSLLKINISLPAGQNSGSSGTLKFITENGGGSISHYWDSYARYQPEDFFLIVGNFDEFDKEDLQDDFEFVAIDTRGLRADEIREELSPLITFLRVEQPGDEEAILTDSLKANAKGGFYFTPQDLPNTSNNRFKLYQSYLREVKDLSQEEIESTLFDFALAENGEEWLTNLHQRRWENRDTLPREFQQRALNYRLENYLQSNPWIAQELDEQFIQRHFLDSLLQTLQFPKVEISFRYVSADQKLYLNFSQDTLSAPPYPIPVKVLTATPNDSNYHYGILQDSSGSGLLGLPLQGSPYYVDVSVGRQFPGSLSQQKPDTYHLFALSNAQTQAGRKEALLQLLETNNRNLFSTTLGIALDDPSPSLRREALLKAGNLDEAAQGKLRDTLRHIAKNDPESELQKLAQSLVEKYYAGK